MAKVKIPKYVVDTFVESWNETHSYHIERSDINRGWCYQFAVIVYEIYKNKHDCELVFTFGHCWIKMNGRHYDAINIEGVDDPGDLCCLSRYSWGGIVHTHKSVQELDDHWSAMGNSGAVDWKTVRLTLNKLRRFFRYSYPRCEVQMEVES
jgi:hypothetical protein